MEKIEIVANDNNLCGEAPIWDYQKHRMIWLDNESSLVYEYYPDTKKKNIISRNLPVSAITLNKNGGYIFAGGTGLHIWEEQGQYRTIVSEYQSDGLAFNDIIADPKGRIYAGTIYWGAEGMLKTGKLYLIDTDEKIRVVDEGIEVSNGLGFSLDNKILYYADSSARKIYAYDVQLNGDLKNKRIFVEVPEDEGIPDGLTVDAQGNIWSAQWYGAQIVCYDSNGKVIQRIKMPVQQVSSVAFGGKDLKDLYITSAANSWRSTVAPKGYDFDSKNIGGAFYRIRMGVKGRREYMADFKL